MNLWVFVFWKVVSQIFPALGTIVTNSGSLPLQSVFNFYQSAFTNMSSCLQEKPERDELGRITPFGR